MSNKGLSFAMSGDLNSAATVLRAAATNRRADARVRQNLALVLALKGELKEAERLARSDLPPQIADQNVQYYRQLVNQPAYWQALAGDDVETPSFEPAPAAKPKPAAPQPAPNLEQPKEAPKAKDPNAPIALQGGAATPAKTSLEVPSPAAKSKRATPIAPASSPTSALEQPAGAPKAKPASAPSALSGGVAAPAKASLEVPAPKPKKD